jgi:O-antigen/teichoic acid export membrane protein
MTNIFVALSTFILLPLLTKNLSASNYGIWIQFTVTIGLLTSVVPLGLPWGMVRFLSAENDKDKIKEEFYALTTIISIVSVIAALISTLFLKFLADLLFGGNIYIADLLPVIIVLACLNTLFLNYFRTFKQMKLYSVFLLSQTYLVIVLAAYFILIAKTGLSGVVFGYLISFAVTNVIMLLLIVLELGVTYPNFQRIREYFSFSLPTVPGNLSYWVINSSDRYVIGILLGTVFVGYYSPGYQLGNVILMLTAPFALILPTVLPKYYDNGEMDQVVTFLKYTLKYFLLLAIPIAFAISILSQPLLIILTTPKIASSGYLVTPFVAVGTILYGINNNFNQIIVLTKKTKINASIWVFASFFNLGLNLILVPYIGILGAAISTLIAYAVALIMTFIYALKNFEYRIDYVFIVKSIIASILMSFILISFKPTGLFNKATGLLDIIILSVISAIVYLLLMFILKGITIREVNFFKKLILSPKEEVADKTLYKKL